MSEGLKGETVVSFQQDESSGAVQYEGTIPEETKAAARDAVRKASKEAREREEKEDKAAKKADTKSAKVKDPGGHEDEDPEEAADRRKFLAESKKKAAKADKPDESEDTEEAEAPKAKRGKETPEAKGDKEEPKEKPAKAKASENEASAEEESEVSDETEDDEDEPASERAAKAKEPKEAAELKAERAKAEKAAKDLEEVVKFATETRDALAKEREANAKVQKQLALLKKDPIKALQALGIDPDDHLDRFAKDGTPEMEHQRELDARDEEIERLKAIEAQVLADQAKAKEAEEKALEEEKGRIVSDFLGTVKRSAPNFAFLTKGDEDYMVYQGHAKADVLRKELGRRPSIAEIVSALEKDAAAHVAARNAGPVQDQDEEEEDAEAPSLPTSLGSKAAGGKVVSISRKAPVLDPEEEWEVRKERAAKAAALASKRARRAEG